MVRSTGKQISTALPGTVTFVYSISGLTVNNAKHVAPQLVKDHSNSDTVILNLGTNDVKFNDHLDIASDYSSLLDKVKAAAPGCKIAISAVSYRTGKEGPSLNYKIDNLNKALSCFLPEMPTLCSSMQTQMLVNEIIKEMDCTLISLDARVSFSV